MWVLNYSGIDLDKEEIHVASATLDHLPLVVTYIIMSTLTNTSTALTQLIILVIVNTMHFYKPAPLK